MNKKINSDQVIIHLVNYSKNTKNINAKINLEGIVNTIDQNKIRLYSPDDITKGPSKVIVKNKELEFIIPELEIYDIIVIN